MNNNTDCKKCKGGVYAIAILGTFLIVGWLVALMIKYTKPAPIGQERAEERRKAAVQLEADNTQALNNYAWQDQGKAIVRLPVERALQLTLEESKNPAAARSNLLARLEKATAAPPKAPAQPSPYE
jgi:hypothetical protein